MRTEGRTKAEITWDVTRTIYKRDGFRSVQGEFDSGVYILHNFFFHNPPKPKLIFCSPKCVDISRVFLDLKVLKGTPYRIFFRCGLMFLYVPDLTSN